MLFLFLASHANSRWLKSFFWWAWSICRRMVRFALSPTAPDTSFFVYAFGYNDTISSFNCLMVLVDFLHCFLVIIVVESLAFLNWKLWHSRSNMRSCCFVIFILVWHEHTFIRRFPINVCLCVEKIWALTWISRQKFVNYVSIRSRSTSRTCLRVYTDLRMCITPCSASSQSAKSSWNGRGYLFWRLNFLSSNITSNIMYLRWEKCSMTM